MSEKTQFIFISQNKLAIEMGENLIGVTMHEPGVSRLVSVDVHEAMTLAGANVFVECDMDVHFKVIIILIAAFLF